MKISSFSAPTRRGFTLVEILVVITIIIVLAATLTVSFQKWSDRAKSVAGISKVRDIGASVMVYAADHDNLPVWNTPENLYWWEQVSLAKGVDENSKDFSRFKSPGHKQFGKDFDGKDRDSVAVNFSYGWNYPVMGRHSGESPSYRGSHIMKMSNFPDPANTLVFADGPAMGSYGFIDGDDHQPDPERYGGKAAAFFLDGAAKMMDTPREFLPDSKWFVAIKPLIPR